MTKDELAAQARRSFDVWNQHDADGVAHFYTSAATVRDSADPDNAATGKDAIAARARMILGDFSDIYWDTASFLRHAGALPANAPAARAL